MYIPRVRVTGPYWPESVRVTLQENTLDGAAVVVGAGEESARHYASIVPEGVLQQAHVVTWRPGFGADASLYRLAMEGERLQLAYACDQLLASITRPLRIGLKGGRDVWTHLFHLGKLLALQQPGDADRLP